MSSTPLSDDLGRRAGFPWYYPVVFLLNLALIFALELLLLYRTPLPLTQAALTERNPRISLEIRGFPFVIEPILRMYMICDIIRRRSLRRISERKRPHDIHRSNALSA